MRNAEVIRQWRILKRIEAGRYTTAQDLADEHGVTERTIRRDIEALQEAGFPLYDERSEGRKVWRLIEGYKQRLTQTFTLAELSALYFSKNLMSFLGGAPFAPGPGVGLRQDPGGPARPQPALPGAHPGPLLRPARPLEGLLRKQDVIAALIDAVLHQRQARIEYFSFNSRRTKAYTIDPYRVVYYHGGLYLYARAHEYGEVRTFAVERIEKIEVRDQTFEMPAGLQRLRVRPGRVRDRGGQAGARGGGFDAEMAGYIRERVWHESQALEDGPGGSVVLRMSVAPGFELKSWIKGFLPHVKVVKPASLRTAIAKDLEAARRDFKRSYGRKISPSRMGSTMPDRDVLDLAARPHAEGQRDLGDLVAPQGGLGPGCGPPGTSPAWSRRTRAAPGPSARPRCWAPRAGARRRGSIRKHLVAGGAAAQEEQQDRGLALGVVELPRPAVDPGGAERRHHLALLEEGVRGGRLTAVAGVRRGGPGADQDG